MVNLSVDFELLSMLFLTSKIDCQYDCWLEKTALDYIYSAKLRFL